MACTRSRFNAVLERALQAEMADHLGYWAGDPAGRCSGHSRNDSCSRTVTTVAGPATMDVPRDRRGPSSSRWSCPRASRAQHLVGPRFTDQAASRAPCSAAHGL
ncbi:transposase [Streptomyces sp. NPDC050743]|uniref:transposase n=1 Tax=Streptomyces sp. NPDC050743 TaxID=3365634 RepID=UPI00379EF4CA